MPAAGATQALRLCRGTLVAINWHQEKKTPPGKRKKPIKMGIL